MSKEFNNPDARNIIPGIDSIRDRRESNQFWSELQKGVDAVDEAAAIEAAKQKAKMQLGKDLNQITKEI